jgi:hypothetical protein
MKKLKILWFLLIPFAWWLSFHLVKWTSNYPIVCDKIPDNFGMCTYLFLSACFGVVFIIGGAIVLAIRLYNQ